MPRHSTGEYPPDWPEISERVKVEANYHCIRCGHIDDAEAGFMLTVHHLDLNKSNCVWWNLVALCQRCHLRIQAKVILERPWFLEHSAWFKPYVAGYYAHLYNLPDQRPIVEAHIDDLILLGQGRILTITYAA